MTRTIRIAYRTFEPFAEAYAAQSAAFIRTHPDVRIEAVPLDPLELHASLIAGEQLTDGTFDLALLLTDWLPEARQRKVIADVSPHLNTSPPSGWPDGWSASMRELQTTADGVVDGVAYHDGPVVLMYRGDLFEDPTEQQRFEAAHGRALVPPRHWDEFVEVARWFTRPDEGLYGATLAGYPDEHNNVYDFLVLLWSAAGRFLTDDGRRSAFGDSAGRWALQFYRDLYHRHQVLPPECLGHESVAAGEFYAGGGAAMMWNWIGFSAVTELESSAIRGANRVTLVPRGPGPSGIHATLNVYWVMTMAAGASDPDLSWSFLRHLASPEMDKVTSLCGGNGTRLSTWKDPEVLAKFPHYAVLEDAHRGARTLPQVAEYPAIAHELSEMTRSVLHDDVDVDAALEVAIRAVDDILAG